MRWADAVLVLSPESFAMLARWALGEKPSVLADEFTTLDVPDAALGGRPGELIDYVVAHRSETDAAKFWRAVLRQNSGG